MSYRLYGEKGDFMTIMEVNESITKVINDGSGREFKEAISQLRKATTKPRYLQSASIQGVI